LLRPGRVSQNSVNQIVRLELVPEKHALGLDPMGGSRFSVWDMRQQKT
jgi:hypothetical protein